MQAPQLIRHTLLYSKQTLNKHTLLFIMDKSINDEGFAMVPLA
jgi:hypothetical protein